MKYFNSCKCLVAFLDFTLSNADKIMSPFKLGHSISHHLKNVFHTFSHWQPQIHHKCRRQTVQHYGRQFYGRQMLNSHHTHCFSQLLHQGTLYKALLSSQDYCCAVVKFSTVPLLCLLRYHLATSSYNSNAKDCAVHLRRGWIGMAESCPM